MTLDTGLAVVLGVGVGALAGIVGGALAAWRQSKLALEKWSRSRERWNFSPWSMWDRQRRPWRWPRRVRIQSSPTSERRSEVASA